MQYDLQKLERMTLDQVREIATEMGLSPRRSQSIPVNRLNGNVPAVLNWQPRK